MKARRGEGRPPPSRRHLAITRSGAGRGARSRRATGHRPCTVDTESAFRDAAIARSNSENTLTICAIATPMIVLVSTPR